MTTPAVPVPEDVNLRRAAARTGWLGIAYAVLLIAALVVLARAPGASSTDQEFTDFYTHSTDTRVLVVAAFYLMPFAGIAFMWFAVLLRVWIRRTTSTLDEMYSSAQLVSGILFLGLFFAGAASISVLAVSADFSNATIDSASARLFTELGWALIAVFAMRMAAVFIMTTSALGRRHGFLPRWFVITGYIVGLFLLLSASVSTTLVLVMPVWAFIMGGLLLYRSRSLPSAPPANDSEAPRPA